MSQNKDLNKKDHEFVKIDLGEKKPRKKIINKTELSKKEPSVNKETDKKIKKELQEIYKNDDGSMPNMRDFKKKKKHGFLRAFTMLLVASAFLAGVAWLGFFVFQPQAQFAENDVILTISGDEKIIAGQEVQYRVRYRNSQNTPLSKVVLQVRYPEGFVYTDSSVKPTNDKNDEWALGSLDKNDSGYIDIYGKLFGDLNKQQSFRGFLNYTPANFSSEFQKVFSLNTQVTASPIEINLKAPTEAVPGTATEFILETAFDEKVDVNNLAIVMESAGGFAKNISQPESSTDNQYLWTISSLGEEKKLVVKGTFNPEAGIEEGKVIFKVVGWKDSDRQNDPYVFLTKEVIFKLLKTDLSLNLVINGSLSDMTVEPGEMLSTSIVLKNAGETSLKNMVVRLVFETPSFDDKSMLDWYKLDDPADGNVSGEQINSQTRRGFISWGSEQIKSLASLDSGKEINIDLRVPLKDAEDVDLTEFTSSEVSVMLEVKYKNGEEQKILTSNPIKLTINSDLNIEVRDKVSENNQNKELHTVTWLLSNSFHELKNIEIGADVYGDIAWQEESLVVPAGKAEWNDKEKKITWKLDKMPTNVDVLALQFAFVLNSKNSSQTNLTSKVLVKAVDTVTNQVITITGNEILLMQ